jgi:hypothetical protein
MDFENFQKENEHFALVAARSLTVAGLASILVGCYSPNQPMLEKEVRDLVQPGMPVSVAVADLSSHGFSCTEKPITCSRVRQRLLPSSCVERVNLQPVNPGLVIGAVDVRPIVCAGL